MADMKTVTINGVTYKIEDPEALSGTDTTLTQANKAADAAAVGTALAGKAPTGFGLGGAAKPITDLNAALNCGWYCWGSNAANVPFPYGTALVLSRYGTDRVQLAFDTALGDGGYHGAIARRIYYNSAWQPWEFVNPPMATGVEYRTTERWKNKVVYVRNLDVGSMPNTSHKIAAHNITMTGVIRCQGVMAKTDSTTVGFPFHYKAGAESQTADLLVNHQNVIITTDFDASGRTANVIIWYTKD